jgi:hypothetical protein
MASTTIVNAAPMTIMRGIQDLSIRTLPIEAEAIPTHLPKVYIYAQKGPTSPQLVVGNGRNLMYGDDTFDMRKPFANHQTVLSNLVNAQGNAQMIERVLPNDIGPKSNFLLSLDVLPTEIVQYERGPDGSIQIDPDTGAPIPATPAATLPGYKVKWVITRISAIADEEDFGAMTVTPGDQTAGGTQSQRYPVLQFWASSYGEWCNNSGIRLWAPTEVSGQPINAKALSATKTYPFRVSVVRRSSPTATPKIVATEFNESFFDFTLKPETLNPLTDSRFSLEDIFLDKYRNITDLRFPFKLGDFGGIKVYNNNIKQLVEMFYAAEFPHVDGFSDFTGDSGEEWLFNLFSGVSSRNVPYYTFQIDTSAANSVRLSENTTIYAGGGSDGTMNDTLFAELVNDRVSEYGNPNSELMDTAVHVESILYDTGFPLATKKMLCKFISERKDTAVVLSTYDVNGPTLTAAEEHSLAIALKTYLQMYPESDYFGTATVRGMIIGRYGKLRNTQYQKKLPLTIELAVKSAKMMGASDGKWKETMLFDKAPNNEITMFEDINVTFTPAQVRNKDWELGLNWVQSFTRKSLFFPALKTVYDNDTSVLNSYFTMMACVELQKVGERVWRRYTGSVALTNEQFIDAVNAEVEKLTLGRFANMYKIVPAAYMSENDEIRGYSWTLPIKLYANNMKTVMTLDVVAYRMSDYQG